MKLKYLGSIRHYSLISDGNVDKRIASATAAFGALTNIFTSKYLSVGQLVGTFSGVSIPIHLTDFPERTCRPLS